MFALQDRVVALAADITPKGKREFGRLSDRLKYIGKALKKDMENWGRRSDRSGKLTRRPKTLTRIDCS